MDELIIDEKKYISSKQAAKLTGYAKDYVGQLCREGRVTAQLVGRSWYVLESAMLDHRFGADAAPREERTAVEQAPEPVFSWKAPRYESAEEEPLPVIERSAVLPREDEVVLEDVHEVVKEIEEAAEVTSEASAVAFDMVPAQTAEEGVEEEESVVNEPMESEEELDVMREEDVDQAEEVLVVASKGRSRTRRHRIKRIAYAAMRTILIGIAISSATFAALNSGVFDEKLTSFSRAHSLTGISVYKK